MQCDFKRVASLDEQQHLADTRAQGHGSAGLQEGNGTLLCFGWVDELQGGVE